MKLEVKLGLDLEALFATLGNLDCMMLCKWISSIEKCQLDLEARLYLTLKREV